MFSQLFLFSLPILPPPSFASFYFAFFLYFLFRIFPLVIITNSPSCCSYHEIYISTLPSLSLFLSSLGTEEAFTAENKDKATCFSPSGVSELSHVLSTFTIQFSHSPSILLFFYFAFFLYFLFRIFPLVIITSSPSCCSYHEIYISTLPSLTYPVSGIQYLVSSIWCPVSGVRYPVSGVRYLVSGLGYTVIIFFFNIDGQTLISIYGFLHSMPHPGMEGALEQPDGHHCYKP